MSNDLDRALADLHKLAHERLGVDPEQVGALETKLPPEGLLGGSIDQTFKLPIHNGSGSISESKTTLGVTITGYFEIIAPDSGTWHIVVKVDSVTVVDKSGLKKGDRVNFTAKTSFWSKTPFEITATWSESADTTLEVKLHATY